MKSVLAALMVSVLLLLGLTPWRGGVPAHSSADTARDLQLQEEIAKLRADVKRLQDASSDQAHAMSSVAYHFGNLWFAAKAENWPLADFYLNETRSHLRWAVRIIPVRKANNGQKVDLKGILEAVENTPLKQLQEGLKAKDRDKVVQAYKFTLESCYSCHKATDKPYLRPQIPDRPPEPIINHDPKAEWPK